MTNRLLTLFQAHIHKTATLAQQQELQDLLRQPEHAAAFLDLIAAEMENATPVYSITPEQADAVFRSVLAQPATVKRMPVRWRPYYWVAAACLLLVIAGVWLVQQHQTISPATTGRHQPAQDIAPGKSGALLTMEDGRTVLLDTIQNGNVLQAFAKQEGSLQVTTATLQYATLQTPRGRTMELVLADGTRVWLNAASSIRFPTAFTGNTREVSVSGEAYFEVARVARQPFHVKQGQMDVEVLGTHFNVNSYPDESTVKTTLLEGAVQVSHAGGQQVRLQPGQQAQLDAGGQLRLVPHADLEETIAWKEGQFQFASTDVKTIMRQLARWYNIEIEYKGDVGERYFTANIGRTKTLSAVVKILEASNIHCHIEGNKLVVTP